MTLAESVNLIFGFLTIIAQGCVVLLVSSWLFGFTIPEKIRAHAISLAFTAALLATLGSLTYSEILGYEPCKLCWIQRILMYPQVLILGLAVWGRHKRSRALLDASLILSAVGTLVALYRYLLQLGVAPALPCAAVGYSVSCSQRFVMEFGYITIPLMALSAFLFILCVIQWGNASTHAKDS